MEGLLQKVGEIDGLLWFISASLFFSIVIFVISGLKVFAQTFSDYEEKFVKSTGATLDEYFMFIAP